MPSTRKSFKNAPSGDRNKEKPEGNRGQKKIDQAWGKEVDDQKFMDRDEHAMNENDPNFDPSEDTPYVLSAAAPPTAQVKFVDSIKDLHAFKKAVRAAASEYHNTFDTDEFSNCIKEQEMPIFHQDIPAIVIKASFDEKAENRTKVTHLLLHLHKTELITTFQMGQGFRKLFNAIDDMSYDTPNAKNIALDFLGAAAAAGIVDSKVADSLESACEKLRDPKAVADLKAKIKTLIQEYFSNEELEDTLQSIKELEAPYFNFEVVKRVVSMALDANNRERELASKLVASATGAVLTTDDVSHGFTVLLNRLEDIYLDVPDVLSLMSFFVARAVVDESLPPSFLVRADLAEGDMGYHVITQSQRIINTPNSAEDLADVWIPPEEAPKAAAPAK